MHRYSRQILLNEIGQEGQKKIQGKKIAVVGVGALGTVAAELLARAGVGSLILIDRDMVEISNLQRQTLFGEKDVGRSKAIAAEKRIGEINSEIKIEPHPIHLNPKNMQVLQTVDLILDCTDNLQTRFLINDYCKKERKPWIYAAAIKTSGYVMPILPEGPCLQCFLSETNLETCDTAGVLNTITVSIASLQSTLALKLLLGKEIESTLYHYDIWNQNFKKLNIKKKENCPTCSGIFSRLEKKENSKYVRFCSTGKYQTLGPEADLKIIKARWEKIGKVTEEKDLLYFQNITLFKDGRALIKANSKEDAQSLYSRLVGN
ncbi:HesA/MoeB/ThiF family protein [Candidatus Woesearchaeota archaeon]|nr:HesA/MoeB/ThiF family protein [Candidatus Woesearchaeota archaeon]